MLISAYVVPFIIWPAHFMAVETSRGIIESVITAATMMLKNIIPMLGLAVIAVALNLSVIVFTLGIGALFVSPFTALLLPVAYLRMEGKRTAFEKKRPKAN